MFLPILEVFPHPSIGFAREEPRSAGQGPLFKPCEGHWFSLDQGHRQALTYVVQTLLMQEVSSCFLGESHHLGTHSASAPTWAKQPTKFPPCNLTLLTCDPADCRFEWPHL